MSSLGVSIVMDLINRISGPASAMRASIGGISKGLAEVSDQATKTARATRDIEAAYTSMSKKLETSQRLSFVGMEMTRIGQQVTGSLNKTISSAADFEESMKAVSLVTRGSASDIKELSSKALEWGSTSQFSSVQVAEAMTYLGRAGAKTKEIISGMPVVMDMADAASMELGSAADIAAGILAGFNLTADKLPRVADVLTYSFTTSNTTLRELGEALTAVAPYASELGLSFENAAAMTGLLANAGVKGSAAGMAMRQMLANLSNASGAAATTVSDLGIELLDMDGNLRNPVELLSEMADAMKDMGSGNRLAALSTIVDQRSAAGIAKLMSESGAGGIKKYAEELMRSAGAAKRAAEQMDNTKDGFAELSNATNGLRIAFGTMLLPLINAFVWLLKHVATGLMSFTEKHKILAVILGTVALVFGGLALAIGWTISTMSGLNGAIAVTQFLIAWLPPRMTLMNLKLHEMGAAALSASRRLAAFALTLLRNVGASILTFLVTTVPAWVAGFGAMAASAWAAMIPLLPLIAVVALIAGAAFLIVKFWQPISGFFVNLWGGIKVGAVKLWEAIKFAFGFSPLGMIIKNWDPIVKYFRGLWDKIGGIIEKITSPIRSMGAMSRGATAGAMAGAAVASAPMSLPASMGNITPIEKTISEARVNSSSSIVAPITIHAAPGQNPEQIASAVTRELDARQRANSARMRSRLYD